MIRSILPCHMKSSKKIFFFVEMMIFKFHGRRISGIFQHLHLKPLEITQNHQKLNSGTLALRFWCCGAGLALRCWFSGAAVLLSLDSGTAAPLFWRCGAEICIACIPPLFCAPFRQFSFFFIDFFDVAKPENTPTNLLENKCIN